MALAPAPSSATRIAGEPGGVGRFAVESESWPEIAWVVEVLSGRRVRCHCTGFRIRGTCRHAEATRLAWQEEPRPSLEQELDRSLHTERMKRVGVLLEQ